MSKTDKEKARKERQRQRHMEEARTPPYQAIHRMEDTESLDAECMRAVVEAMHEAAKYESRCEVLAALVEFARTMIEQARAAEAERAREAAAAATASAAAERLRMEEEISALRLRVQKMQTQLGVVVPATPAPQAEA
jgi:hypothetical protein